MSLHDEEEVRLRIAAAGFHATLCNKAVMESLLQNVEAHRIRLGSEGQQALFLTLALAMLERSMRFSFEINVARWSERQPPQVVAELRRLHAEALDTDEVEATAMHSDGRRLTIDMQGPKAENN